MTPPLRIALCTPIYDHPKRQFWRSIRALQIPDGAVSSYFDCGGIALYTARNMLARAALDWGATHVVWIDADMVFGPSTLVDLLRHDAPIVGALYFNRSQPYQPLVYVRSNDAYHFVYDYATRADERGLVDVDGTGGGFLVVKREVFYAITRAHFAPENGWFMPRDNTEEDLSFCQRAKEAGYRVCVDAGVKLGHIGEVVVNEAFAARNREGGAAA